MKQRRLLIVGVAAQDVLVGIPHRHVTARPAIGRKVAFHHATVRSEGFDRGFNIRPPGFGQFQIANRIFAEFEAEPPARHAQASDLAEDIRPLRKLPQSHAPAAEDLGLFLGIHVDADGGSHMVQHEGEAGESIDHGRELRQRRVEYPRIEGETALFHFGKAQREPVVSMTPAGGL